MSIMQSMYISRNSMANNELALTVVSQNVSNLNTENYIKLRADFETAPTYNYGSNPYSAARGLNGAVIGQITSYADVGAANALREATSNAQYYSTQNDLMTQMLNIANELGDDGLSADINSFFEAAHNLSNNPTDVTARRLYVESAQNVAAKFNHVSNSLDSTQAGLVGDWEQPATVETSDMYFNVRDFNEKLEQLALLNEQIAIAGGTENASGMINQREGLLNEMSSYMDITVEYNDNGTVNLKTGDMTLIRGSDQVLELKAITGTADEPSVIQLIDEEGTIVNANANDHINGGHIGAILDLVNGTEDGLITISDMIAQVDSLMQSFADEVNAQQTFVDGNTQAMALGENAAGEQILVPSTEPMFIFDADGNMVVNEAIVENPNLVATARVDITTPNYELNVGNTDNIVAVAQLRDKQSMSTFGGANNATFEGFLTYYTGEIGLQSNDIKTKFDTAATVQESAQSNLKSITGVNLDEELADMIKYQRAYEASARVFGTADEILEVLVNLGR